MQCPVYDPGWLICEHAGKLKSRRTTVMVSASIDGSDHDDLISEVEVPLAERQRQAQIYLEAVPGTQEGNGADRSCTALTMRLLFGFALPADTVLEMLAEWGQRSDQLDANGGWYPWTEEEISRKIEWCLRHEYSGEVGDRLHAWRTVIDLDPNMDDIIVPFEATVATEAKPPVVIQPQDQLGTATQFFSFQFEGRKLVHCQGCWYHWSGTRYELISDDDIKARLWKWLGTCRHWSKSSAKDKRTLQPFQPNRSGVSGVLDALKAVANHPSRSANGLAHLV